MRVDQGRRAALCTLIVCGIAVLRPLPVSAQRLVPEGRIAGEGAGYFLTEVIEARIAPDGSVVVRDRSALALLQFDTAGAFVARIGGEGGGPGEFRTITRWGFVADTLWVADGRQRRVTWFHRNELADVVTVDPRTGGLPDLPAAVLKDGTIVSLLPGARFDQVLVLRKRRSANEVVDRIAELPTARMSRRYVFRGRSMSVRDPFAAHVLSAPAVDGSGITYIGRRRPESADSASFTVVIHRAGETTTRNFAFRPRPLAPIEIDRRRRFIDAYVRQLGSVAGFPEREYRKALEEALPLPRFSLPVLDAVMDPRGRVWLAVEESSDGMRWTAVDERGYTGEWLLIPSAERLMDVGRERVLTVREDQHDVPSLTIYRMRPGR